MKATDSSSYAFITYASLFLISSLTFIITIPPSLLHAFPLTSCNGAIKFPLNSDFITPEEEAEGLCNFPRHRSLITTISCSHG
jgi:hypothetical protein